MHALRSPLDTFTRLRLSLPVLAGDARVRLALACSAGAATLLAILGRTRCYTCLLHAYDDAYITYRYAHNLATGHGLVFNPGDATDSASSLLYTLLLALCHLTGLHDLRLAGLCIGLAGAAATAACVTLASLERTRRPFFSVFLGLVTGYHGLIGGWSVSGMETTLYSALVSASVYRLFVVCAFGWLECALVSAAFLTRLEGLLLVAAWLALCVAHLVRATPRARRPLLLQLGALGSVLALFALFKLASYGTVLPHAFQLKRITPLYAPRPQALADSWRTLALGMSLGAAAGLLSLPRRLESAVLLAYVGVSVASVALGPYADWVRYSAHLLPVAAMLASVPLSVGLRELPALALAACALLAHDAHAAFESVYASMQLGQGHAECRERVGSYLEAHLPKGTLVVSSDLGAIAYAAPSLRFFDTVGLTSKDVVQARAQGQSAEPLLFDAKPEVIADTCAFGCSEARSFSAYKWQTQDAMWLTPLPEHPSYLDQQRDGSSLVRCQSPDGLWFGAAQLHPAPQPRAALSAGVGARP